MVLAYKLIILMTGLTANSATFPTSVQSFVDGTSVKKGRERQQYAAVAIEFWRR